jgi:hypothetical protein
MTMPDERTRALFEGKRFIESLLNPKLTPKVPKAVRQHALSVLRHYPSNYDLLSAIKAAADSPFNSWDVDMAKKLLDTGDY